MPRRAAANRREVQPDAVYNNRLVTQLINKVHPRYYYVPKKESYL